VIISRALRTRRTAEAVQRRILFAMHQVGATAGSRYRKCAAYVGEC